MLKMKPGVLYFFMKFGLFLLKLILGPLTWILFVLGERKKCPKIKNPLLLHSAKKLALLIRTKQIKSEEVVQAYIAQAKEVNKVVNAIVEDRFNLAIEEAQYVDQLIASNTKTIEEICEEMPLLGVPVTIKESHKLKGMSCNAGRVQLKQIAEVDSGAVRMLKNAGAIPILVSNTPESCMFWETYNPITGKTLNPYDTRRTVGGSSGGEAALICSGGSVIGLGSDLAGSLRLPAAFCGIFSHKPTGLIVPTEGNIPKCYDENFLDYFVIGPLTRYAEDLPLMMSVLAEPTVRPKMRLNEKVSMTDLEFYYMEREFDSILASNVDRNIVNAMKKFVNYLQIKYGITAEKVNIKEMQNAHAISSVLLLDLDEVDLQWFDKNGKFQYWSELLKLITCRARATLYITCYATCKLFYNRFFKKSYPLVNEAKEDLKNALQDLLGDNGILLYPTFTGPAHYHYQMFLKMLDFAYMAVFNALGLPVTNCPAGFTPDGLPIGFQVISNQNNDRLTIAVAEEIERYFGGWKAPN